MHKLRLALAPALAATFVLTGCGGGGGSSAGSEAGQGEAQPAPKESAESAGAPSRGGADLVIWTDALKADAVKSIAEPFGKANGISVAVQAVSSDLQTNFVTANAAGNGPDVVVGAHDWIGNLVQNGAIDPLPLTPEQLSGYSDIAVQATTYENQLYGVPYGVETLGLYRNTEVAPKEPATLDEAIAMGRQAVEQKKVDSALNLPVGELGDAYHMQPLYTSMGGYLFGETPDGDHDPSDVGVGRPGSLQAARKISQLAEQDVLRKSITGDNSIALFTSGKAAFLVSGPWALPDIRESGMSYDVQPMPGFAGEEPARPFMGAQAFMVASNARNKAFAQEFVTNAVNTEDAMLKMFEGAKLPPSMTAVQEKVAVEDEDVALFAEAANRARPMPAVPEMTAVWEPLGKAYAAIVGGANPTRTMKDAGQSIRRAIGG